MTPPPAATPGKREAILGAALELFAERGFHGTAVPEIAERAKVGAGTLYRYFEHKEAIVNALYQEWKTRLATELVSRFPMDAPPYRQFKELWARLGRFAREYPSVVRFMELHHHAPYLDAASRAIEENVTRLLREYIVRAQRADAMKPLDPDVIIALVNGAFVGLVKGHAGVSYVEGPAFDEAGNCLWEAIRR